jgi:hypothetical protein
MKHVLMIAAAVVMCLGLSAYGRELGHLVQPKDGKNIVDRTGEALDFQLTAERDENGAVLVSMVIPAGSELQKASYLRLQITKGKEILLWTRLPTGKRDDGASTAGFQIHESLAKDAFVGISYDATVENRMMYAYLVPVAKYITQRTAAAKAD